MPRPNANTWTVALNKVTERAWSTAYRKATAHKLGEYDSQLTFEIALRAAGLKITWAKGCKPSELDVRAVIRGEVTS